MTLGLVAVYMQKLGYWGVHDLGVRVGALTLYPAGGPYICFFFFFFFFFCGGGAVPSSSPPAGGGVGSY